jgi:IclR family mhp operon transcriptional activator
MHDQEGVKSVKKVLRALMFLNSNGESTVSEVARGIGVPRPTAYRLLQTLSAEGYLEKQPHSDVYRMTSLVQRLSSGFTDSDMIIEVAKPLINRVGAEIRWPLALATPRGEHMVVRITTDYDTSLAIDRYMIGFTTPILHSPTGLCYLAYCDEEIRQSIAAGPRSPNYLPEDYPYQGRHLDYYLQQIRSRGYCHICYKEYPEGGLAVPLVVGGKIVGGLIMRYMKSILLPDQLEKKYLPMMQQLAKDISTAYDGHANRRTLDTPKRAASAAQYFEGVSVAS